MEDDKQKSDWLDELRRLAEEAVGKKKGREVIDSKAFVWMEKMLGNKNIKDLTTADMFVCIHELQVHQVELEMQNEELKRSRQELEASRNKYLELYEFSPIGYFTLDNVGAIIDVNLTGAAILGVERGYLSGRRFQLFVKEDLRSEFNTFSNRVFGYDAKQTCELQLVRNDASPLYACLEGIALRDDEGQAKRCLMSVVDITARKRTEAEEAKLKYQLFQAHNMASVGILAGGVAHNFNNLLMVVMGYASLLQMELNERGPLSEYAQKIITATQMAANLSNELLAFSKKKPARLQSVNINKIIKGAEGMLLNLIRENSKLRTTFTEKDCCVVADSDEITHVLINLAANARDAMPNGGELKICTDVMEMDETFIMAHGFGAVGKYVLISFSDTGVGMDEDTRLRIFEPFFTTKAVGNGTGLGLATVYWTVKQHQGYIDVESRKGIGTTFRIYLPVTTPWACLATDGGSLCEAGTETVLLAEDEADVRDLIKIVFERNGYEVIEAVDGKDAVDKFVKYMDKIHILLFDIIMPVKSGKQAYDEIKKIKPDAKVIFMSGYNDDIASKKDILNEGLAFIWKPVSPARLLEKVREALDK